MADSKPDKGQRTDWVLVVAIAAFSFLILLSLIWQVTDFITDDRLNSLIPWQTAIAALIGFAGLIITTWVGFYQARHQQKENARLALESREHQAKMDRKRYAAQQKDAAQTLASALHGELKAMKSRVKSQITGLRNTVPTVKELAEENSNEKVKIRVFPDLVGTVFKANANCLGLLGKELAFEVAWIYGMLCNRRADDNELDEYAAALADNLDFYIELADLAVKRTDKAIQAIEAFIAADDTSEPTED